MITILKNKWHALLRQRWPVIAALVVLGSFMMVLWTGLGKPDESLLPVVSDVPAIPVAAAPVVREDLWKEQVFEAEFRPYQEIDLHAKVTGFLDKITVDIGDQVKAGQLIASLEIPELADDLEHAKAMEKRSQEEVKRAEAANDEAHLIYSRLLKVVEAQPNLVAQQDIDAARSKDLAAAAGLAVAREQVAVAQTDVKKLTTMFNYSKITAPFDGVITKRYLDPGALVQGGTASTRPVVRLSQNDRLRLDFPASVSFASLIRVGDPLEIAVPSLKKTYQGSVSRFSRRIDFETRSMEVEAEVPNPDLTLIPGIYASAMMRMERKEGCLTVPVEAVSSQQHPSVYLIGKDGAVREQSITLGMETPTKWEVLSGLKENDLVMVGSRAQVRSGQKVTPKVTVSLHASK